MCYMWILLDLLLYFRAYLDVHITSFGFSTLTWLLVKLWVALLLLQNLITFLGQSSNFTRFILLFISLLNQSQVIFSYFHFAPLSLSHLTTWLPQLTKLKYFYDILETRHVFY